MILQVHDELVFEVGVKDQEAVAALVKQVMENACEPAMKLSGAPPNHHKDHFLRFFLSSSSSFNGLSVTLLPFRGVV
jgi:hypothetical protein